MPNESISDDDRLTEIGRLLALGALRMLRKERIHQNPPNSASKTLLAPNENPWLIVDGREKFEGGAS